MNIKKVIRWFRLIAFLTIAASAVMAVRAEVVSTDRPCTSLSGPGDIARIVSFYDDSRSIPGYKFLYYQYAILCDGSLWESGCCGDQNLIGRIPTWAFPFTIAQTVTQSNGHTQTQVLSAGGFLAATIDYDGVSESATFTAYPSPLQ